MKNEFVDYKIALELKSLGFNKPCFGRFFSDHGSLTIAHTEKYKISNGVDRSSFFTLAPLKQQVFKFFRENYGLNSFIELVYDDGLKYDYVLYTDEEIDEDETFGDGPFNNHEEADKVLIDKLIEIVELKHNE